MAYSTGESKFRAKIHNEREITPEFVLNEARSMWSKCKRRFKAEKMAAGDAAAADRLMTDLRREHKEFCTSYPIVMRYMAEMQVFHPEAFRKYLVKIAANPWKTEGEYLDSQADYIVLLYKETHKRWNATEVNALRNNVRSILQNEHDAVKKYHEDFTKEVESEEKRLYDESRENFIEFLKSMKGAVAADAEPAADPLPADPLPVEPADVDALPPAAGTTSAADILGI